MDAAFVDSYWLAGTTPLWTAIALAYCLASVYLSVYDSYDHPTWVWLTFLMTGTAVFLLVNHQHILGRATPVTGLIEAAAIGVFAAAGVTMFLLARDRARQKRRNDQLRYELEMYKYGKDYDPEDADPDTTLDDFDAPD